jgi:hypothetical protein
MLYARASAGSRFGQWFMVAPPAWNAGLRAS